ncbi:MAG TPA: efflux RND transporter periplasmic adaptor subunit [Novosphingobium sp.]|nr:efflux RND transporter periplasmic adaptor subunit [Novosphingobium sp.]
MQPDSSLSQARSPKGLRPVGIAVGALALIVVLAGTWARHSDENRARQWSADQAVPSVHLIAPTPAAASNELVQPGTIEAWTAARIFARVPGYVHGWYADIGQRVAEGAPLGRIDTPELDQQIVQARAALERAHAEASLARTTAARWQDLLATTSVSRQAADEKSADAATRNAAVHEAQANLGRLLAMKAYATVRAPFGGIVTLRNADIGDLVGPGATNPQPMFGLADDRQLRIYVDVPQQYAPQMRAGLAATLSVPAWPGRSFTAKVMDQSGAVDSQSGSLKVELLAANPDHALKPGGFAQVHFALPVPANRVSVPASALIMRSGGTRVATVTPQGRAHLIPVVIGHDMGNTVEIASGLPQGTKIIDSPPDSLAEGDKVAVAPHG